MIKLSNILVTILFYILFLSGIIWLYNKLADLFKIHTDLPESNYIKEEIDNVTYPEGYKVDGFNEWAEHIYNLNSKR